MSLLLMQPRFAPYEAPPIDPPPSGAVAVDYRALPLASTEVSVPNYTPFLAARSADTATPWSDPYTGRAVYRLTTDAEGSSYLGYGNGGPWVSLPDANGVYWIASAGLVASSVSRLHLIGFKPGEGRVGAPIDTGLSDNVNNDIGLSWSHVSANVLYRLNGRVLRKYTWNGTALAEVTSGVWPKDLSSFGTALRFSWLSHSADDSVFCMVDGGLDRLVIWDAVADTVTTINASDLAGIIPSGYGLDEGYLSHDGRYLFIKLSPLGFTVFDRETGHVGLCIGHSSHPSMGRGKAWMVFGFSVTNTLAVPLSSGGSAVDSRFEWVAQAVASAGADVRSTFRRTTAVSVYGASAKVLAGITHSSISHVQDGAVDDQWWIHGMSTGNAENLTWDTAWTLHSGAIYARTWASTSRQPATVVTGTAVATAVDAQLTPSASLAAMVAGTFFVDAATRTLYVWHADGATVTTTNTLVVPRAVVQQGVYAVDPVGDGTEDEHRAIAFSGIHPRQNQYYYNAFASTSPDGRVCVFNSDFGRTAGPRAICATVLPTVEA